MNASERSLREPFFRRKLTLGQNVTLRRSLAVLSLFVVVGSLVALGSRLTGAEQESAAKTQANLMPVRVQTLSAISSYRADRSYTGLVAARRASELGFERSAEVTEILVDQGQWVRQGQGLAHLDRRQLELQKRKVAAERDQAAAVLEEFRAGPRLQTIKAARGRLKDLEAQVELQKRNYKRVTELFDQNATSKSKFDEIELGLKSSQARLTVAKEELDELEAGTRTERIAAQAAAVAQLDAQLADLDIEISDSTLVAPYDGQIAKRFIDEGTVVAPAQPILKIVETSELEAHIGLPSEVASTLAPGEKFNAIVGNASWSVEVDRLLPDVDLQTRTQVVIFRFDNDLNNASDSGQVVPGHVVPGQVVPGHVVPGQVVRVVVEETHSAEGFWVPTTSLVRSFRGLWAVYVVEADSSDDSQRVRRRDVEVLYTDGTRTLVRGMLVDGDRFITTGTQRIVPGQQVQPIEELATSDDSQEVSQ